MGERLARLLVIAAAIAYLIVLFFNWFDYTSITGHEGDGWSTVGLSGGLAIALLAWQVLALFGIRVSAVEPQRGAFLLCAGTALWAGALILHLELRGAPSAGALGSGVKLATGGWIAIVVLVALALAGLIELQTWRRRQPAPGPEHGTSDGQKVRLLVGALAVTYLVVLFLPWYRYDPGVGIGPYVRDGWDSGGYVAGLLVILLIVWQGLALLRAAPAASASQPGAFVLAATAVVYGGVLMYVQHKGVSDHSKLVWGGRIAIFVSAALLLTALLELLVWRARTRRAA